MGGSIVVMGTAVACICVFLVCPHEHTSRDRQDCSCGIMQTRPSLLKVHKTISGKSKQRRYLQILMKAVLKLHSRLNKAGTI